MVWYKHLYTSESVSESDVRRIRRRIKLRRLTPDIYLIALASNPDNLLDIIPSWNLLIKGYPRQWVRVIGIAWGYDEAVELVRRIVQETYDATGGIDVKDYLKKAEGV